MTPRAAPMAPSDRRRAIIDAVVPLLHLHGPAFTTKQVAEAAGIAEGTIFRVFPDKRSLLHATAEAIVDPTETREALEQALADDSDLRSRIEVAVVHLVARIDRVMTAMMALRPVMAEMRGEGERCEPPGPPAFVIEANRRLTETLTACVFAPHRDELRLAPEQASLVLRGLVFGLRHPGMETDPELSVTQLVDVVLHGVAVNEEVVR